jgi:hypothetical protein
MLIAGIGMKAVAFIWPPAVITAIQVPSIPAKIAIIAVAGLLHGILAWAYKTDPQRFEVYAAYARMGDLYQPWPLWGRTRAKTRPVGYGRDARC